MPQITVTITDYTAELISAIVAETGRSQSSLCASYIQEGVYKHIDHLSKVEAWKSTIEGKRLSDTPDGTLRDRPSDQ
jgi:hypothetical protein